MDVVHPEAGICSDQSVGDTVLGMNEPVVGIVSSDSEPGVLSSHRGGPNRYT